MKNKKYLISFISLISLIIILVVIFIVLVTDSKKDKETLGEPSSTEITTVPTLAPSATPEPTKAPVVSTSLFPAFEFVNNEKKYGYIDKTGTFVIPPSFESAEDFNNGVALVTFNGEYCVIDENGTVLFVNKNALGEFHQGLATSSDWDGESTTLYGYVDKQGNTIVETKYLLATTFNEDGTAYVAKGDGQYARIDQTGKELETYALDPKFDTIWNLQDGYLIYSLSGTSKYGVINMKGEEILEPIYSDIIYMGNGLFAVKKPGLEHYLDLLLGKQAIFNNKGEQLTDYSYYDLTTYYEGYCSATDNNSTFFVDMEGQVVETLPKFEGRGYLRLFGDIISAEMDGDLFYAALDGTVLWQLPDTFTLSDTLTIKSIKFKPNRHILVRYPQIEGLDSSTVQNQVNQQLKSIFTDHRKALKAEEFYSVEDSFSVSLINNLLIISRSGYDYSGGAHGMPIMDYFFIDRNNGTFYQLKDLFLADSDYKTKINQMITDEMNSASEDAMYFPETFAGITDDQHFRLEQDALIIYFYPYDIAAYAAGFPEFIIPFEDIMEFIDVKGSFWNCLQSGN